MDMQFIFRKTVVAYEWMPDCPTKKLIDIFAYAHDYNEGQSFDFAGMVEYFTDEGEDEAVNTLNAFMCYHNLDGFSEVRWSW